MNAWRNIFDPGMVYVRANRNVSSLLTYIQFVPDFNCYCNICISFDRIYTIRSLARFNHHSLQPNTDSSLSTNHIHRLRLLSNRNVNGLVFILFYPALASALRHRVYLLDLQSSRSFYHKKSAV